ncbi:FAD-dependent oxidoreductase [Roseibacillus persicicus]|uniref:FAD-dependent oxidoreductase n=1 Tax=Roseibacillus persicicus TaxID=454148 RepID=UPI00280FE859|nr:FAD-dependent oxidoreductase [Roseibacillus persicicus]MDQ8189396.1 FAD-dependent oxidoreductase [Roseibacillus persicicus]
MGIPKTIASVLWLGTAVLGAEKVLLEAEAFSERGNWKLDTQFIELMGSPYLLAHGMGQPVGLASGEFSLKDSGDYRVWVRTVDWSEQVGQAGGAGQFQLSIDGEKVGGNLGAGEPNWSWETVGEVTLEAGERTIQVEDLTGFNGRFDAVYLSNEEGDEPPNDSKILSQWRRDLLGLSKEPTEAGEFDLVVVGGGYGGMGTAISAARNGCKVALIESRQVLGGNGSSEVRVWAMGDFPPSDYPLSDIIEEFMDEAEASPAPTEQFGDAKKEAVVKAEGNITLFLNQHAFAVEMEDEEIAAVHGLDTRTSEVRRFSAPLFADCTGHGWIASKAGADTQMEEGGRMGMSNMWMWGNGEEPAAFPQKDWMLSLSEKDFPFPVRFHGQWFWEAGFDQHPIDDLEKIRDWNLIAVYSAWNAMKNKGAYAERDPAEKQFANAELTWLAHIGGTRETQQVLGDVILTEEDIVEGKEFPDACVLTTWSIDLHYPNETYLKGAPENPFISKAVHNRAVDRKVGSPIPYRCFYSRNVPNLFTAGRNISVTHEALGTVRVMKTIGMMGVVVGKAAAICIAEDSSPRGIYEDYLPELKFLMSQPGEQRYETIEELKKALEAADRAS